MTDLPGPLGWSYPALAALLGVGAAWWLGRRAYRREDDPPGRVPSRWWVPVLALVGTVAAAPSWRGGPAVVLATYVAALVWALTLAVVDLEVQRLPDQLVLPAYPATAVLLGVCAVVTEDGHALLRAAACAGAGVLAFLALALLGARVEGLGLGDVKLAGVLAALLGWFGWYPAVLGLAAGFVLGGVGAFLLLVLRRVDRRSSIAFGPAMILGGYLCGAVAPLL